MPTTRSNPTCPECRSSNVVPIIYGLPTEEVAEEAKQGKFALGGCCFLGDSPQWHCRDCEHEWGITEPDGGNLTTSEEAGEAKS